METIKERYQALQAEAVDWDDFTTWNDVLESVEGYLSVDIFGVTHMERFGRQVARAAYHGTLVQVQPTTDTTHPVFSSYMPHWVIPS